MRHFAEFVDGHAYRSAKHWSATGVEWRDREGARAPLYWEGGPDGWERVRFGVREPLPPNEPVQHVSYHEAEAFAHWAGKRLPTEVEWERAAAWHDHEGKFRYPWGQAWMGFEASLDRRRFSPAPAGSYAGGVSPVGCVQMAGDVWEWTSSGFHPYPGFVAFPGPGVLRGELRRRRARAARGLVGDRRTGRSRIASPLGASEPPRDLRRLPLRARRVGNYSSAVGGQALGQRLHHLSAARQGSLRAPAGSRPA